MELTNLTPQQLRKAADLQERIISLQEELSTILGDASPSVPAGLDGKKKRTLSRAGRAAIAAASRARWAKAKGKASSAATTRPKRVMSAAARAKLAAVARERWKKAKAAGRAAL